MQHDPRNTRRKLFASLAVLTVVFTVAAIAQFTGTLPNVSAVNKPADKPTQANPNQPRAVFGEVPPAAPVSLSPVVQQPQPKAESKGETARSRTEVGTSPGRGQIEGLLDRWRDTFARGDVNGQTILYAPKMEVFYQRSGVSRETVRREKSRMMELYPRVHRYEISNVKFESHKHDEAVVSFRKDWDMNGDRRFSGAE